MKYFLSTLKVHTCVFTKKVASLRTGRVNIFKIFLHNLNNSPKQQEALFPKEREKKKRKEKKRNSALVEIGTKRVRAAFGFVQMKLAQKEREHFRQARTITVEKGARIFLRGERNRKGNSMNRGTSIRGWLNSSGSIDQPASLPLCFAPIKSVTLFAGPSGGLAFAS